MNMMDLAWASGIFHVPKPYASSSRSDDSPTLYSNTRAPTACKATNI